MRPWAILGAFSAWVLVSYKLNVKATPQERALPFLERVQRRFMQVVTAEQQRQQGNLQQQGHAQQQGHVQQQQQHHHQVRALLLLSQHRD